VTRDRTTRSLIGAGDLAPFPYRQPLVHFNLDFHEVLVVVWVEQLPNDREKYDAEW
jgi:hypothetical protein